MKEFLGTVFVFILWMSACLYYVSTKNINTTEIALVQINKTEDSSDQGISTLNPNDNNPQNTTLASGIVTEQEPADENRSIGHAKSRLLADEIQKNIRISDTVDIEKDEPKLEYTTEIEEITGPSFSTKIFYPTYKNTDLILDPELVAYATQLKNLLKENDKKKVTIIGHTDNVGNSRDNFANGLKKSRQIKWYLTARRGIPRRKITAISRGEEEPIATNKTRRGRKENNRIEIIVD